MAAKRIRKLLDVPLEDKPKKKRTRRHPPTPTKADLQAQQDKTKKKLNEIPVEYMPDSVDLTPILAELPEPESYEMIRPGPKGGTPTHYNPNWHPVIALQMLASGAALCELVPVLGKPQNVLHQWTEKYPRFATAIKIGTELSKAWWYTRGRKNLYNPHFNPTLFMMNMQNRYGWARKMEGNIAGRIDHAHLHMDVDKAELDLSKLSIEELELLEHLTAKATPSRDDKPRALPAKAASLHSA